MFKCFKFIDDMMRQLNEANEAPAEDDVEISDNENEPEETEDTDTEEDAISEEGELSGEPTEDGVPMGGGAEQDPSQIADVEMGTFVSPIAKANWANFMLKFLKDNNPNIIIPTQFETVTTENADQIIEFVKSAGVISEDEFGDSLNNI